MNLISPSLYRITLRLFFLFICFTGVSTIWAKPDSFSKENQKFILECERVLVAHPELKTLSRRSELYKTKAALIGDLKVWAKVFYKSYGAVIINKLTILGDEFPQLVVDPGIVMRLSEFTRFVRDNKLLNSDPWKAREKFSQFLGNKTVYRSVSVDDEDAENILKNGMKSDLLRNANLLHDLYIFDNRGVPFSEKIHSIDEALVMRQSSGANPVDVQESYLLSVTDYPEVGNAVALSFLKPGKKVMLATLSIPVLDIVYPSANFGFGNYFLDLMIIKARIFYEIVPTKEKAFAVNAGSNLESFVFYNIHPEEIVSFTSVQADTIGYIASKTRVMRKYTGCFGNCPEELLKLIEGKP